MRKIKLLYLGIIGLTITGIKFCLNNFIYITAISFTTYTATGKGLIMIENYKESNKNQLTTEVIVNKEIVLETKTDTFTKYDTSFVPKLVYIHDTFEPIQYITIESTSQPYFTSNDTIKTDICITDNDKVRLLNKSIFSIRNIQHSANIKMLTDSNLIK